MTPNVEWSKGHRFTEYAEAVGVPVDHIMAVGTGNPIIVLFTPEGYDRDNPVIVRQALRRESDNILRRLGLPEEQPGMWDRIKGQLDERLGGQHE